jgi:hypothetical protein
MTAALIPSANTPMLKPLPIFFTGSASPLFRSEHLTELLELEHPETAFLLKSKPSNVVLECQSGTPNGG